MSGYTQSGYCLLPGFPGFDATASCKGFNISAVATQGTTAQVEVTETWHIPHWIDNEPIPSEDETRTTIYTVEKTSDGEMRFSVGSLVFFVYSFCARQSPVYRTVIFV